MDQNQRRQYRKDTDEVRVYIEDALTSLASRVGDIFRDAVEDVIDGADARVIESIGKSTERAFRNAAKMSEELAANSAKISAGMMSSKDISRQQLKLDIEKGKISRKLQHAELYRNELGEERFKQLEEENKAALASLEAQEKLLEGDKKRLENIEKNMGSMGALFTRLSKNKFFGSLLNAEEGLIAMRKAADQGTKGFALMGKGISAAFKGIEKASVVLFGINLAVKAMRFVLDLFVQADNQTTEIARNLGTSKESADGIRQQFVQLRALTGGTRNNIKNLTEALAGVKQEFGIALNVGNMLGDSITFLTKRLKISSTAAAKVSLIFDSFGQNVTQARYEINEFVKEFAKVNAFAVPLDIIINDIAEAGEGMAANYGFSAKALGNAALQARKFGLSLAATKSVSESMLDFESSLAGEIKLSLFLQRRVNFAKARGLALDGKTAEATTEVFRQLQGINKEQMKSPIFQKFAAEATGLTVDQLNRGFLLTQKTNEALKYQNAEYKRIYELEGKEAAERFRREYNLSKLKQSEIDEIDSRMTAQEKFAEAVQAMKETFSSLMGTGVIDKFINALDVFANFALRLAGYSKLDILNMRKEAMEKQGLKESDEYKELLKEIKDTTEDIEKGKKVAQTTVPAMAGSQARGAFTLGEMFIPKEDRMINAEDFTIRTHPKDTLVMAGGTKLGSDNSKTNELLEKLITAVEKGGSVYLDIRKVGQTLEMNTINLG